MYTDVSLKGSLEGDSGYVLQSSQVGAALVGLGQSNKDGSSSEGLGVRELCMP